MEKAEIHWTAPAHPYHMLTAPKTSAGMVLTEIQKPANVHLRQNLPYPQHLIQNQFALWICAGMVHKEIKLTALVHPK